MVQLFSLFIIVCFGFATSPLTNCFGQQTRTSGNDSLMHSWKLFGSPITKRGTKLNTSDNQIEIQAKWATSSWGIGISHLLESPVDGRSIKSVKAKIKTLGKEKIYVHAGLSNKAGGNLSQDMRLAKEITSQWKEFEFLVSEMAPNLQQALSPTFGDRNFDNVQYIHLFFLKPRGNAEDKDSILIQTPVLTYVEENIYAAHKN